MKKSILVVMCDFIVLSMLSMITGLTTLENPYGEAGTVVDSRAATVIVEALRKEESQLAAAKMELEEAQTKLGFSAARAEAIRQLDLKMEETRLRLVVLQKGALDGTAELLPERLPGRINQEVKDHARLRTQYQSAMRQLEVLQNKYTVAQERFGELNRRPGVSGESIRIASAELVATREELAKQEATLLHARSELAESVDKLRVLNGELEQYQRKLESSNQELANANSKLNDTTNELTSARKKLLDSEKAVADKAKEIEDIKRQVAAVQSVLRRAVKDLADERSRSEFRNEQLQRTRAELRASRGESEELASRLTANVLSKYAQSAVKYDFYIREDRLLGDDINAGNYFLPVVMINNRSFVIGNFWLLSGLAALKESPDDVSDLKFSTAPALQNAATDQETALSGPIYVLNADCRMALIEAPGARSKAATILDFEGLKKRGIEDLYLFKPYTFGHESTPLGNRCSLSMDPKDRYLYIRNATVGSEMAATPGDFVMTRDGQFVGVVVRVDQKGKNITESKCVVLPANFGVIKDSVAIQLGKSEVGRKKFFDNFSSGVGRVVIRIKNMEKAHK